MTLPVDIVFAPDWWHHHTGLTFDEDFFYHPQKRVEAEQKMEQVLYDRFGQHGLGSHHNEARPEIGPVHLAAGYLLQEMLGCTVEYHESGPPTVLPADLPGPSLPKGDPFASPPWRRLEGLTSALQKDYGYVTGDINWGGILNIALDLRGQELFVDMQDEPQKVHTFFESIAGVLEEFTRRLSALTGTTSISVNRLVGHCPGAIFLHSQCSHTMISVESYRTFLMPYDLAWSQTRAPYGIHFCGSDPHRFAKAYGKLPELSFLDVGWGGDVGELRKHLPNTFLSIRLDPVSLKRMDKQTLEKEIHTRVAQSANLHQTGLCCINMDKDMPDATVQHIFETAETCVKKVL